MDTHRSSDTTDPPSDATFMRAALDQALLGRWSAPPNPPVGAVVVAAGRVVGVGHHRRPGTPHAETIALEQAGEAARGATLYVTLEPCNHQGRTPPCTQAILEAGITRVVYPLLDPNSRVEGGGGARLRAAGVEVSEGIGAEEAEALMVRHLAATRAGRPHVIAKSARTLDGRIGTPVRGRLQVSGAEAMRWSHRRRSEVEGVLVGIGTLLADDPALSARGEDEVLLDRQPVRIVADGSLRTPPTARLFTAAGGPVLILTRQEMLGTPAAASLEGAGALVAGCAALPGGPLAVPAMLAEVAERGIDSILVEGGATLLRSFAEAGAVDLWHFVIAPKVLGDGPGTLRTALDEGSRLGPLHTEPLGPDLLVSALPA